MGNCLINRKIHTGFNVGDCTFLRNYYTAFQASPNPLSPTIIPNNEYFRVDATQLTVLKAFTGKIYCPQAICNTGTTFTASGTSYTSGRVSNDGYLSDELNFIAGDYIQLIDTSGSSGYKNLAIIRTA